MKLNQITGSAAFRYVCHRCAVPKVWKPERPDGYYDPQGPAYRAYFCDACAASLRHTLPDGSINYAAVSY